MLYCALLPGFCGGRFLLRVRCGRGAFRYADFDYSITARDAINNVHARGYATEDSVAAIKVWLRAVRDEPLRAAGVFARKCHADCAPVIRDFVNLATNLVARTTVSVAARVAALYDEVRNDAMKRDVVEVAAACKLYEVVNVQGSVVGQKFNRERAFLSINYCANMFTRASQSAVVIRLSVARSHHTYALREIARAVSF